MAKMVITSNICIFFILKLVSKIVLDYLFFIDKSKSNRRRYRKGHNFLYKFFTGYVYSKKHMNESRCRNYIRVIYAIYVFLMTSDLVLLILVMDSFGVNSLIRNDMGIFNWIATSYSQIVTIDATGSESIIYDVNSMQLTKTIVTISLICVFVFVAVAVVIWQFIKLRRGN